MSKAVVVGTGVTTFGKAQGRTVRTMADEAARAALADAGVARSHGVSADAELVYTAE